MERPCVYVKLEREELETFQDHDLDLDLDMRYFNILNERGLSSSARRKTLSSSTGVSLRLGLGLKVRA